MSAGTPQPFCRLTASAITLPMDRFTGLGYGLREGDHVDLIVSFLFVDVDEIFQTISPNKLTIFSIDETTGEIKLTDGIEGRPDVASFGPVIIGPSEKQRPRMVTQMTVQDAIVVHVGEFPLKGNYIGEAAAPTPVPATEEAGSTANTGGGEPTAVPPTPIPPPDMITLAVSPERRLHSVGTSKPSFRHAGAPLGE